VSVWIRRRRADVAHAAALGFLERLIAVGEDHRRGEETTPPDAARLVTV